jgi:hypothetical protein
MILVSELDDLIRQYIDEPDATFVNATKIAQMRKQGIRAFRRICKQADESLFTHEVTIHPNNVVDYDLSDPANPVNIYGVTGKPVGTPLSTGIVKIYAPPEATGTGITLTWTPAPSLELLLYYRSIWINAAPYTFAYYYLQRPVLKFAQKVNMDLHIVYQTDELTQTISNQEYVDDLEEFSDLIALLACQTYQVRDGAINQPLQQLIRERTLDLNSRLWQGQDRDYGGRVNNIN